MRWLFIVTPPPRYLRPSKTHLCLCQPPFWFTSEIKGAVIDRNSSMDKFWLDFATTILPSISSYELQEYGEMCLCLQARDHLHSFENRRWHSDRILTVHNFSFEAWNASRPAVGLLILLAGCSCSDPKPDVWPRFGLAHSRKAPAIDFHWRRPSP